jgi:hypothetical protein
MAVEGDINQTRPTPVANSPKRALTPDIPKTKPRVASAGPFWRCRKKKITAGIIGRRPTRKTRAVLFISHLTNLV